MVEIQSSHGEHKKTIHITPKTPADHCRTGIIPGKIANMSPTKCYTALPSGIKGMNMSTSKENDVKQCPTQYII